MGFIFIIVYTSSFISLITLKHEVYSPFRLFYHLKFLGWVPILLFILSATHIFFLEWMDLFFPFSSLAAGFCMNVCLRSKGAYGAWKGLIVLFYFSMGVTENLRWGIFLEKQCTFVSIGYLRGLIPNSARSFLGGGNLLGLGFPRGTLNS